MMNITRRALLAGAGALAATGSVVRASTVRASEATSTVLTAGRRTLDVNGRPASVFGLRQPDGTAGLFTEVDVPFRVTLRNEIGVDTLVHWHGLTPPYRQDGVSGISGPPIPAGASARYDFPLAFPGTFWMHSHQGMQEQSLLSAPLIIRPKGGIGDRQEVVMLLHDFAFRAPSEIYAGLRHPKAGDKGGSAGGTSEMVGMHKASAPKMSRDLNDVSYDALLANDRTVADPDVVRVEQGGRILLRVINAAASSNFLIDLGAHSALLVAVDGHPVQPVAASAFPVAVAQRIDLEIRLDAGPSALPVFATLEGEAKRSALLLATAAGTIPKLAILAAAKAAPLNLNLERRLRSIAPLPRKAADRTHRVDLTGDMSTYVWSLNGVTYGQDSPLMVAAGDRVELVMTNKTMMAHPMHLHGHVFQVVAIDGQRFDGAMRDTVLVPPKSVVTVAFDADNPGHWAFHCHNLYHMEAGMMTTVHYEGTW
ncbi:multicopper oxidase family protein [Lichenifustis flavocetrariae]|uniref:Multicopper oxidase domain-containing protein n=1 Tax=Lichenifustis flavocetrariae TaxID=2949735 RepID=A0AA42CQS4_9HYPH|nr:multicopper oxidase domain-containing protein [Lichenifustis flavocetrariae]MCW6511720.1 multicopper oxidase domain-containing protein [Lichenifustis flavocetrariae]